MHTHKIPTTIVRRPQKWDTPFGDAISPEWFDQLIQQGAFALIREDKIKNEPDPVKQKQKLQTVFQIISHECRIIRLSKHQPIFMQGNYGNSAYFVLKGAVSIHHSAKDSREKIKPPRKSTWQSMVEQWRIKRMPEVRKITAEDKISVEYSIGTKKLKPDDNLTKTDGHYFEQSELFGLLSCLRRTERLGTAFANTDETSVLEIKWQGLRDLMGTSKKFKAYCESLYRQRGLNNELGRLDLLANLSQDSINKISESAVFESFGKRNWLDSKTNVLNDSVNDIVNSEPVIFEEGEYASSINIVSYGFIRMVKKLSANEVTVGFLKSGDTIGLSELFHNAQNTHKIPFQNGYKAIGYVDLIRIPLAVFEQTIAKENTKEISTIVADNQARQLSNPAAVSAALLDKSTALVNKLINHRLINGTRAMVINLDKCTGCDDCVRACAATHQNNPRFVRQGVKIENIMIANACMHCVDPLCLIGCPTGAISRFVDGGQVTINDNVCIGCATCANNCPYQNIKMVHVFDKQGNLLIDEKNTPITKATKCDFCYQQKVSPACEGSCPHDALRRIDMQNINQVLDWMR